MARVAVKLKENKTNLYLLYNNNTWLQIGHKVILLGGESGKTIGISCLHKKPYPAQARCGIRAHDLPVTQCGVNT